MGFLDNLKNVVGDAASSAQSTTKEFVEVTKLKNNIRQEKNEIDELYKKIGECVYDLFGRDLLKDEALRDYCENINHHKVVIEELEMKISQVKEKE